MKSFEAATMRMVGLALILCLPALAAAQRFSAGPASGTNASASVTTSGAKFSTPPPEDHRVWESCPALQQGWYTPTWDNSPIGSAGNSLVGSARSAQGSLREIVQTTTRIEEHANERVQSQPRVGESY